MVSNGSPKLKMIARGSSKFERASWNPALEKSLVDILIEYKDTGFRDNGCWNSEGWNRMVKEFHDRNKHVSFSKAQIQEKEGQLKKDYKMLKQARSQSGSSWNYERHMVEVRPAVWDKLIISFPKIKKFRNNKATFPLYDALRELHDGHLAEGIHNKQIHDVEDGPEDLEDRQAHRIEDEDRQVHRIEDEESEGENERKRQERHDEENEVPRAERSRQQRRVAPVTTNKEEKEGKKPRKSENIEGMMERYLEMRTKQAEDEAAHLATMERYLEMRTKQAEEEAAHLATMERYLEMRTKQAQDEAAHLAMMERYLEMRTKQAEDKAAHLAKEKDSAQGFDFSIKRCIVVLSTMEVTKEEKAKAYTIFIKSKENRESFLCACEEDPESAMIWLRSEIA